ncbi:MAG: serine--tRNA ligase [Chloroflexi bacterium]|jgi:seryl-tRNA synthetase|uniref:Serine--tRNA ligase n=1 Tax=Candidatus Thermofonsia Clade 3 bacterium TaxID=2364212 RepID=A0A2M8QCF0_9CHLR|nr:serine--tRNA ligase [Candidatus Roseilinea sp. NK_OTU-006]PJF47432.1 MAG: serine--tRNA ligase [Candidatus Thermofonsia Clade 3 bacterium]RMG64170.1 MAG: serine--tRNA ligase [Chloroflexota bacterium]
MLDINLIRKEPEIVRQAIIHRGNDPTPVDEILALDTQRREILARSEQLRAIRNAVSKEIGRMRDDAEREAKKAEMRRVGDEIDALEAALAKIEAQLGELTAALPNLADPRVPIGPDETHNVVLRVVEGTRPPQDFSPKPHWEIGEQLGIIDFERGVKLSGSRFYVLNGWGARLQRGLIAWMLDLRMQQGYEERYLPFMVKAQTLFAAGQLPKFRDNLYHDAEEDFWMVPTAEVPLTNLHGNEILDADDLPRLYAAYTPCFRREKMSAGRDVRGIKRGHQFDKVEMYAFTKPEDSDHYLEKMREDAEATLKELGLTYRVKLLCTGDLSFASRITYDLEVWSPGVGEWLEVSSVSNVGDFQARRANIKFRRTKGAKPEFVHTLNGSGLGLPRTLIAVLENYQQADGSVVVPEALRPYVGADVIRQARP